MVIMPGNLEGYLTVRLTPGDQESTIQYLRTVWESYTSAYPFVYYYLDRDRQEHYLPVRVTARVFLLLSVVAILIAGLGLFAFVSFLYSRRQLEIGLQKVMGASNCHIVVQKVSEVVTMVVIASILAWIGVYFLANAWFDDYAYHVNLTISYFLISTVIVTLFSLLTILYHTSLAVKTNPGITLKYE